MLATTLIKLLEKKIEKYGNHPVEIDSNANLGIVDADRVLFQRSDSERGDTIIITSDYR